MNHKKHILKKGIVISSRMDKTIIIRVDRHVKHKLYKKIIIRSSKLHVHDEKNIASVGDMVLIKEVSLISKNKGFVLIKILGKGIVTK